jgi:NDP-sugar pyrophosphorylase family protein
MDCCNLSSTGLQDIDANDIIADNITILSNLNVSGSTYLYNSLNVQGVNILNSINNLNNIINNNSSTLNINSSNLINFYVNNTQLTKIDTTGLSIYHPALETFPYNHDGWYNIGDRFNKLFHVMSDSPHSIINYDAIHNTVIRISEQDIVNQIYYPRQIQFQTY